MLSAVEISIVEVISTCLLLWMSIRASQNSCVLVTVILKARHTLGDQSQGLSLSVYTLKKLTDLWDYWSLRLVPESNQINSWGQSQGPKMCSLRLEFRLKIRVHTRGLVPEAGPCDQSPSVCLPLTNVFNNRSHSPYVTGNVGKIRSNLCAV